MQNVKIIKQELISKLSTMQFIVEVHKNNNRYTMIYDDYKYLKVSEKDFQEIEIEIKSYFNKIYNDLKIPKEYSIIEENNEKLFSELENLFNYNLPNIISKFNVYIDADFSKGFYESDYKDVTIDNIELISINDIISAQIDFINSEFISLRK